LLAEVTRQALPLAAGVTALVLFAAGCGGGSQAPSVASLGTTGSIGAGASESSTGAGSAVSPAAAPLAWSQCMNAHGVAASPGPGGRGFAITANVDPGSPQLQAAQRACQKLMPGGGPPTLTPAQKAQRAKGLLAFATCMRKNGVSNFPDPDPNGFAGFPPASVAQIDPSTPFFQTAYKACRSLFPRVGPQIRFG
jgi:hypothetical protein